MISSDCRCKGPVASSEEEEAEELAIKAGWYHDKQRHGHWGEAVDRWFCPHHREKFNKPLQEVKKPAFAAP